jgi:ubiquinone/menaquinone biosynthesis C-methylase UbiE
MTVNDGTGAIGWLRAILRLQEEIVHSGITMLFGSGAEAPSPSLVAERYGAQAPSYDLVTAAGEPYRLQTVDRLDPMPGEVIVDVGCGTGLNFPPIEEGIGRRGMLVGVDLCAEMLATASQRADRAGWRNVRLIRSAANEVDLPVEPDAALFCGTHDILRSPAALENVVRQLRPGGRVVAAGPKWAPPWRADAPALNFYTWQLHRPFVTTVEGFDRPWSHLERLVPDLRVEECFFGGGYIAEGTTVGPAARGHG